MAKIKPFKVVAGMINKKRPKSLQKCVGYLIKQAEREFAKLVQRNQNVLNGLTERFSEKDLVQ